MHGSTKVRKWGNSLGIYIPKIVADNLNIHVGSRLQMSYCRNKIEFTTGPTDSERLDAYLASVLLANKWLVESTESESDGGILEL